MLDTRWWQRSAILLNTMAAEDERLVHQAAFNFQLALMGNPALTEESFNNATQTARKIFNEILNAAQPWNKLTLTEAAAHENDNLVKLYREVCGDTRDPEVQKRVQHDIELLALRGNEAAEVTRKLVRQVAERRREIRQRHRPPSREAGVAATAK